MLSFKINLDLIFDYMTTIDTRVDIVTITLKAKENSCTNIHLNYTGTALSENSHLKLTPFFH